MKRNKRTIRGGWRGFRLYVLPLCGWVWFLGGCRGDETPEPQPVGPNTCLSGNEIVISDIAGIPEGVTFDRIRAEICGTCWKTIDAIEGAYTDGKAVLTLPEDFPEEKLQESIRIEDGICGYWVASSDNPDARVAGLRDIIAYDNDRRVGRLDLTDFPRTGSAIGKSWVYFHYADRPFSLTGTHGTYRYAVAFTQGWNAYININQTEGTEKGAILCTTSIPAEKKFVWRFESWVY